MDSYAQKWEQNNVMIKLFATKLKFIDTNCILCKKVLDIISIERTKGTSDLSLALLENKTKLLCIRLAVKRRALIEGLRLWYQTPLKTYTEDELNRIRRGNKKMIKLTRRAEKMLRRQAIPE